MEDTNIGASIRVCTSLTALMGIVYYASIDSTFAGIYHKILYAVCTLTLFVFLAYAFMRDTKKTDNMGIVFISITTFTIIIHINENAIPLLLRVIAIILTTTSFLWALKSMSTHYSRHNENNKDKNNQTKSITHSSKSKGRPHGNTRNKPVKKSNIAVNSKGNKKKYKKEA
ncbi:MAG: hypothetical protein ACMXYL_04545 [Candidatus Woesearchaeota archaeon]